MEEYPKSPGRSHVIYRRTIAQPESPEYYSAARRETYRIAEVPLT